MSQRCKATNVYITYPFNLSTKEIHKWQTALVYCCLCTLYDFLYTLLFQQIKRCPKALKMLWNLQNQIFRPNVIWLVSYKSGYSLCPTHQDYENGKIKRKLSTKVGFFACANCLLAILDNYIPTGLRKCDESPSEIMETNGATSEYPATHLHVIE